jgi:pantothenate kinase
VVHHSPQSRSIVDWRVAMNEFVQRPSARLLGIAGPPGSGKSTLAAIVAAHTGAVVIPMDGFHLADDELARLGRADRKGAPDTFDTEGFLHALARVRRGDDVYVPRFDRVAEAAIAGSILVPGSAPLVVVEGNYLLLDEHPWERVRPLLDACWWLEVDDAVRVPELVARHVAHGRSPSEAAAWVDRSDEANTRRIRTSRRAPDAIVSRP